LLLILDRIDPCEPSSVLVLIKSSFLLSLFYSFLLIEILVELPLWPSQGFLFLKFSHFLDSTGSRLMSNIHQVERILDEAKLDESVQRRVCDERGGMVDF
jgi:hypothetical protein